MLTLYPGGWTSTAARHAGHPHETSELVHVGVEAVGSRTARARLRVGVRCGREDRAGAQPSYRRLLVEPGHERERGSLGVNVVEDGGSAVGVLLGRALLGGEHHRVRQSLEERGECGGERQPAWGASAHTRAPRVRARGEQQFHGLPRAMADRVPQRGPAVGRGDVHVLDSAQELHDDLGRTVPRGEVQRSLAAPGFQQCAGIGAPGQPCSDEAEVPPAVAGDPLPVVAVGIGARRIGRPVVGAPGGTDDGGDDLPRPRGDEEALLALGPRPARGFRRGRSVEEVHELSVAPATDNRTEHLRSGPVTGRHTSVCRAPASVATRSTAKA